VAQARGDAGLSEGNAEATQNLFRIWNSRDFEALIPFVTNEIEWVPETMSAVEGGSFQGVDGLREFFSEWDNAWKVWEVTPAEVRDEGDCVLVLGHVHAEGRGSGLELDQPVAYLFEFRGGLLAYGATFYDQDLAEAAFRERSAAKEGKTA
jgi:ketosteroid isomerase-like protein